MKTKRKRPRGCCSNARYRCRSATRPPRLRYYESNRARFHNAPLLAVRHILLECAPDDAEARSLAHVQAELLLERLDQFPGSFAELAPEAFGVSIKEQGGSLGQISKGQTVPELERQLFTLPAGLAGKPLESRYGWHVISIDQRIDGQPLPYEAVATAIRTQIAAGRVAKSAGAVPANPDRCGGYSRHSPSGRRLAAGAVNTGSIGRSS